MAAFAPTAMPRTSMCETWGVYTRAAPMPDIIIPKPATIHQPRPVQPMQSAWFTGQAPALVRAPMFVVATPPSATADTYVRAVASPVDIPTITVTVTPHTARAGLKSPVARASGMLTPGQGRSHVPNALMFLLETFITTRSKVLRVSIRQSSWSTYSHDGQLVLSQEPADPQKPSTHQTPASYLQDQYTRTQMARLGGDERQKA